MRVIRVLLTGLIVVLLSGVAGPAIGELAYAGDEPVVVSSDAAVSPESTDASEPTPQPSPQAEAEPTPPPSGESESSPTEAEPTAEPTEVPPDLAETAVTPTRDRGVTARGPSGSGRARVASGLNYEVFNGYYENYFGQPWQGASSLQLCTQGVTASYTPINEWWGEGSGPQGCSTDNFAIHYYGHISYPTSTTLCFANRTDDGFYMTIDGQSIFGLDQWAEKPASFMSKGCFAFTAGTFYPVDIWYYERYYGAEVALYYGDVTSDGTNLGPVTSDMFWFDTPNPAHFVKWQIPYEAWKNYEYTSYVMATGSGAITYALETGTSLPPGLSLNSTSGAISGTPTTPGTYNFRIVATADYSGTITTQTSSTLTIQVFLGSPGSMPPYWEDPQIMPKCSVGDEYYDEVIAYGEPSPVYALDGNLPPGISLNEETGTISGECIRGGNYTFRISASNAYGAVFTQNMTFLVKQEPTRITESIPATATVGRRYLAQVTSNGWPQPQYSLGYGSLPPGISINQSTGEISGTPTQAGTYSFSLFLDTSLYHQSTNLFTITVNRIPTITDGTVAAAQVGKEYSDGVSVDASPAATYAVSKGSLPPGLSLNATTGAITGQPTVAGDYKFTVTATNSVGSVAIPLGMNVQAQVFVDPPPADFGLGAEVGEPIAGAPVTIQSSGMQPNSPFNVILRSEPQIISNGVADATGTISSTATIPGGLEPGWHSITLSATADSGQYVEQAMWFQITASGLLESTSDGEPTLEEKATALSNDEEFFEEQDINPATQAAPEIVNETVQNVSTVVASVALVSATAAVVASAAAASTVAAAGSATSAGAASAASGATSGGTSASSSSSSATGARTAPSGSGSSPSGSSSSGSGGSSSGGSSSSSGGDSGGGDGDSKESKRSSNSRYENLDADNEEYATLGIAWGDALALWAIPLMTVLDRIGLRATIWTARISPVLSRVINDGSYLRAIVGAAAVVPAAIAIVLGVTAVTPGADAMALSASVPLVIAIIALGTLDAFAGLAGMSALAVTSLVLYPLTGLNDVRYLITMFILGFAPVILATTFRKIRRQHEHAIHLWERTVDVFMVALIGSLTTISLAGGINAFVGVEVPLADSVPTIALVVTGVALIRVGLEELATRSFPTRLHLLNPVDVPEPSRLQEWASLAFKYAVLVIMVGDMIGWDWWLWVGAAIMFVPSVIVMTADKLPKSKLIAQLIPGGLGAFLLATLLSTWTGDLVTTWFGNSPMYVALAFILIPLPVILTAIVAIFSDGSEKWYNARNLTWVYIVGGAAVFAATVYATDFVGNVFG